MKYLCLSVSPDEKYIMFRMWRETMLQKRIIFDTFSFFLFNKILHFYNFKLCFEHFKCHEIFHYNIVQKFHVIRRND